MARVRILVVAAALLILAGCVFQDAVVYGIGTGRRVTIADFNGDHAPDVAVAAVGTVSVLRNNGNGTFADQVNYTLCPTCANPSFGGIVAGDFNGDDRPDIAATDGPNHRLWVLMNKDHGKFRPPVGYEFLNFSFPDGVAAADLDGDGDVDLAVAAANPVGSVTVWRNNGRGTFDPAPDQYAVAGSGRDIAVGDFNGDTAPDLAVTSFNEDNVAVLLNNHDGTFGTATNYAVGDTPTGVAISDLDGDAALDLVTANSGSNTVSVLLGVGHGSFGVAVSYAIGQSPAVPTIANLGGSPAPDIAVANTTGPQEVSFIVNQGDGTFGGRLAASADAQPFSVASGDLNADGLTDIAVGIGTVDSQGGLISILLHR
jgi:FG-GAP-like repeat